MLLIPEFYSDFTSKKRKKEKGKAGTAIRKTLFLLFRAFRAFSACGKQKKLKFEKHCLLGKSNPLYFLHTFFSFSQFQPIFLCKLDHISHQLFFYQPYFLYFFDLIYLCKQSTCMMSLASTLASTGDYFFYFFAKKHEK